MFDVDVLHCALAIKLQTHLSQHVKNDSDLQQVSSVFLFNYSRIYYKIYKTNINTIFCSLKKLFYVGLNFHNLNNVLCLKRKISL